MRIFLPLRHRALALVWCSQVLSAVGDDMNKAATVWVGAGIWGPDTGYLMALQAAFSFLFSVFGGLWADGWAPKRTMVVADIIRCLAMLSVPVGVMWGVSLQILLPVTIAICASLTAFFEPALRSSLPALAPEPELLRQTNALIETTARFARVIGPGIITLAGAALPVLHLFTLDAVSFAVSAVILAWVPASSFQGSEVSVSTGDGGWKRALLGGVHLVQGLPLVRYMVVSGALVSAAWWLILPLGMGLLVHERAVGNVSALGAVMAAYGVGNLSSSLAMGNLTARSEKLLFGGRIVAGVGFILFSMAPNLPLLMLCGAFAATGGPATDVGTMGILQVHFRPREVARVYRLILATSFAAMLVLFFVSPHLFRLLGVATVIGASGVTILVAGAYGYWLFARE